MQEAGLLKGNEILTIVQQGKNKQISLSSFIKNIGVYVASDFLNISKSNEDSYTLEDAIASVVPIDRKAGQVITFMDSISGDWAIYQFKGKTSSEWFNIELWDNILAKSPDHFKGIFLNESLLMAYYPKPQVGDFVFVGTDISDAEVYVCIKYGEWYNTKQAAFSFADKYDAVYSYDFGELETKLDETYADRATKDTLGNVIHDTYITREGLTNAITEIVNKAINELVLPAGSVTVESLSEAVLQLFNSRGGKIYNYPDEEDLTVKSDVLKFADKSYSEAAYSGYGRTYLRKNIVDGINVLEQYQMEEANTRYIVQYFHCLNGQTITVPENCIIDMTAGGIISNGTLSCNDTVFIVPRRSDLNVTLEGTYTIFGE